MSEQATEPGELQRLPSTLSAGAKAFQKAVDGKLTSGVWEKILDAQIQKAEKGDPAAAKFLIEYAGGVASFRGATFVQETHNHTHHHEQLVLPDGPKITEHKLLDPPPRSEADYIADREAHAQRVAKTADALHTTGRRP